MKECVQFYYLWKKNSIDQFKRLRIVRRKRESMFYDLEKQTKQMVNCDDNDGDDNDQCIIDGKTSRMFHCKVCGKKFRNLKSRSAHMRAHVN